MKAATLLIADSPHLYKEIVDLKCPDHSVDLIWTSSYKYVSIAIYAACDL